MIRNLRRRFICFSVLVISIILLVLCLLVFFHQGSALSAGRLAATLVIGITLVALGSWLLSKAAIAPVQKAWQKQLDFTADASHELRTPLAVIRTNLELVMDSPQESVESQMKWLENIEVESSRMTRLIDDLLTLSRADTNRQVVEQREFILEEALGEALLPLEAAARQRGIGMHTEFPRDTIICGDRDRMKQLAVILVNNAILYSDAGACVTVAVSDGTRRTERRTGCRSRQGTERRATHWVELRVSDTGCGMDEDELSHIFDRFYRGQQARQRNPEGSGLGLAIVRWIVSEHGGKLRVISSPGEGTEFVIELPALSV